LDSTKEGVLGTEVPSVAPVDSLGRSISEADGIFRLYNCYAEYINIMSPPSF